MLLAAGIVASCAMNAAATADQSFSGSMSNCVTLGEGNTFREVGCGVYGIKERIVSPVIGNFKLDEISMILPTFSGRSDEDVHHFVTVIENARLALSVSCFMMKLVVIRNLKARAQAWLHSHADYMLQDYEEILRNLKAMFDVPVDVIALRKQLEKRTWSGRENFAVYCQSKRMLAQRLQICEKELVEYIVEGIEDVELRNQARLKNFYTIADIAQAFRMIKIEDESNRTDHMKCFCCNQMGHVAAVCRLKFKKFSNSQEDVRLTKKSIKINVVKTNSSDVEFEGEGHDGIVHFKLTDSSITCSLKALFDTGSPISLIRRGLVDKSMILKFDEKKKYRSISGERIKILGVYRNCINIQNNIFKIDFYVVPDKVLDLIDAIIGRDVIMRLGIRTVIQKNINIGSLQKNCLKLDSPSNEKVIQQPTRREKMLV